MSCFGQSNMLYCRTCFQETTLSEEKFPSDLFSLLSEYNIPQIHWFCKSCNLRVTTTKDIEEIHSRVSDLETKFKDLEKNLLGAGRGMDIDKSPLKLNVTNVCHPDSTFSPPKRCRSSSPTTVNRSFGSGDCSPIRNKDARKDKERQDALRIIQNIVNNEILIDKEEAQNSIKVVDAFMMELNPFLKKIDPVFKYLYSRDYKTGSSYNDLKISAANEYDINIMLIVPQPFELKVDFFEKTMAFAKIKWSQVNTVPDSKSCILKFFKNNSDKDGYLIPLKVKAWFQGIIDKFYLSNPKIQGIKEFTVIQSGPARTIVIETEKNYSISLDLVPVFSFGFDIFSECMIPRLNKYSLHVSKKFCSFVPKSCEGEQELLASDCKLSWRIYVPEFDKKVLHNKQNAKVVIRLLKLLRDKEDWKAIASYHLVTVILWEIEENPTDWSDSYDRFIKALEKLQEYLDKQELKYFLYPKYNLFHSFNVDLCKNWSFRIQYIVKSIKSDPNNMYTFLK